MLENRERTILLVEDEAIIALNHAMILGQYGYKIITANSGESAISVVDQQIGIDLILMDIDLGHGMNGLEAAEKIMLTHTIPILFLSSHTDLETVKKTEKMTSFGYVVKNTGNTVLDASIKMAFKLHESNQQLQINSTRLELALSAANLAWWEMVVETGAVVFDKRKTDMLGYSPEGFKHYSDFTSLIHPDDLQMTMTAMKRHLSGETERYKIEYRIKKKDGSYIWFRDIGQLVKGNSGNRGTHAIVTGITINIMESKNKN
jgi:PAS domain S-box-containing protein